ncbi:MAG: DUF1573 domain-containing protein [Bacteroidia bacterium]|nr:DUF1573 domain-containing protein [Bacteroidia bacterium]MDW8236605.1 DUF1573 domain-containing protein [Bacteroidia bacterium]
MYRAFLFLAIGCIGWSQSGRLRIEPAEQNFGQTTQGTLIKARFLLINEGKSPVQIQDIKPSCNCSVLSWEKRAIAPGDSLPVEVAFNTAHKVGRQRKSFSVISSAENSPTFFFLTGEVLAQSLYGD